MGQQPPGFPQTPWQQQPVPPDQNNTVTWLLAVIAVLLVVVSVGATLFFTRSGNGTPTATLAPPTSVPADQIASATDTGPVAIITADPTCPAWAPIATSLSNVERSGWGDRDKTADASQWTAEQRAQTEAVATAMRNAADQVAPLARKTPRRGMRELYEQFIAYGRAYADSIPTYTPSDDFLAAVNVSTASALVYICYAIDYGSATSRSLALPAATLPTQIAPIGDPSKPHRFLTTPDSTCVTWVQREDKFTSETQPWTGLDPNIPAPQWTPEQHATQQAALQIFTGYANAIETAGRQSGNPVLEDFAVLSAQYFRAYVGSGDTYVAADNYLSQVAVSLSNLVPAACRAAGG